MHMLWSYIFLSLLWVCAKSISCCFDLRTSVIRINSWFIFYIIWSCAGLWVVDSCARGRWWCWWWRRRSCRCHPRSCKLVPLHRTIRIIWIVERRWQSRCHKVIRHAIHTVICMVPKKLINIWRRHGGLIPICTSRWDCWPTQGGAGSRANQGGTRSGVTQGGARSRATQGGARSWSLGYILICGDFHLFPWGRTHLQQYDD